MSAEVRKCPNRGESLLQGVVPKTRQVSLASTPCCGRVHERFRDRGPRRLVATPRLNAGCSPAESNRAAPMRVIAFVTSTPAGDSAPVAPPWMPSEGAWGCISNCPLYAHPTKVCLIFNQRENPAVHGGRESRPFRDATAVSGTAGTPTETVKSSANVCFDRVTPHPIANERGMWAALHPCLRRAGSPVDGLWPTRCEPCRHRTARFDRLGESGRLKSRPR
uniref:Uncharacterized protein n=1 Tax=Halorubrum lacusprofundi TaxID=2247 RepID=A0A218KRY7_9EURY|nr:hypothetical protein [Halorubrum lacusprofundi]